MKVETTELDAVKLIRPIVRPDDRGYFVKTFQESAFAAAGLQTQFTEHFFSRSKAGVIRGLHFQVPPAAQDKFVFCAAGEVTDFVVDLRTGSPTYGKHTSFRLSAEDWTAAYIPTGFAHGFLATTDAVMAYFVSAEYDPACDTGIRWNSAGIDWDISDPIVSDHDRALVSLDDFDSPFTY